MVVPVEWFSILPETLSHQLLNLMITVRSLHHCNHILIKKSYLDIVYTFNILCTKDRSTDYSVKEIDEADEILCEDTVSVRNGGIQATNVTLQLKQHGMTFNRLTVDCVRTVTAWCLPPHMTEFCMGDMFRVESVKLIVGTKIGKGLAQDLNFFSQKKFTS